MTNNKKILYISDESRKRQYNTMSLPELKKFGKNMGLLNVDQYTKRNKNILIGRLVKGKQLNDESKNVLLEQAKNTGLKVNASMSKEDILRKISSPELKDLNQKRLRKIADENGIILKDQMTDREIIQRLENPTNHYNKQQLKRLARDNNIDVRRTIKKQDLINILVENNIITSTPITAQESNLGVMVKNIPEELRKVVKKKAQNAREAMENFKQYIKNLKKDYITPSRLNKLSKQLEKKIKEAVEERKRIFAPRKEASAFKNYTTQYVINGVPKYDPIKFLKDAKPVLINILNSNRNIKIRLFLNCLMKRVNIDGFTAIKPFAFHSKGNKLILESTDLYEIYDEIIDEIEEEIQKTQDAEGSGWVFVEVENLALHTSIWDPINAGSYIDLPKELKNKKAIINMKNEDNECFKWCVLRALYPKDRDAERIDKDLKSKQNSINMKGIKYPVRFRDIDRFESQNPEISITILGYNKDERVYPLKISRYTGCEHDIVLSLLKDGDNSHYCLIKNISALLASQINSHKGTRNICLNCFNGFNTPEALNKHKEYCYNNECVKIVMPPPDTYLRFKNFLHSEKAPFAIYADFESLIKPMDNCDPDPNKSYTKKYQKHEPISFSYYITSSIDGVYEPVLRKNIQKQNQKTRTLWMFLLNGWRKT